MGAKRSGVARVVDDDLRLRGALQAIGGERVARFVAAGVVSRSRLSAQFCMQLCSDSQRGGKLLVDTTLRRRADVSCSNDGQWALSARRVSSAGSRVRIELPRNYFANDSHVHRTSQRPAGPFVPTADPGGGVG